MDGAAKGSADSKVAVGVGVGVGLMLFLLLVALLLGLAVYCCRGWKVKDDKVVSFSSFQNSGGKAPTPAF